MFDSSTFRATSAFALRLSQSARAPPFTAALSDLPGMFGPLTVRSPAMPGSWTCFVSRLSVTGVPSLPCTARSPVFASRSTSKRANWICFPFASSADSASLASIVCCGLTSFTAPVIALLSARSGASWSFGIESFASSPSFDLAARSMPARSMRPAFGS